MTSCCGKTLYPSKGLARKSAAIMKLRVYRCHLGNGFHLTSHAEKPKKFFARGA